MEESTWDANLSQFRKQNQNLKVVFKKKIRRMENCSKFRKKGKM